MKKINITLVVLLFVFICRGQEQQEMTYDPADTQAANRAFGEKIDTEDAIGVTELSETYANLSVADSVQTTFKATVTAVCKAKGCWMKLQLEDGNETMVRFKDYGFFMPMDIEGRQVVVNGRAFVEEMSVEDQKHYAKDGGKSEAEIAAITATKKTYGFEADGVLLMNDKEGDHRR